MQKKIIARGAEAVIYADSSVIKERVRKGYRIKEIDSRLRKFRTKRESKILQKLKQLGFPAPKILNTDDKEMIIEMEKIDGSTVRDVLENRDYIKLGAEIGKSIAMLHNNGIIHGDLTTSNFIINKKDNRVFFIDFGLGFFSEKTEDKAVDLHLLRQALESKHYTVWKKAFDAVIDGYKRNCKNAGQVLARLKNVEERGKNKGKGS